MTLTTLEAEDDRNEQSLQKYPDSRFARAGSRSSVGDAAPPAYAGTDLVRARMPAPQERPTGDEPVVDSPPCTKISNRSRMRNAKMDVAEACCDDIPSHFPSGCFS